MTLVNRYTSSSHTRYSLYYHIVFCTKYRRKVLEDGIDELLKKLFLEKAEELGITIESMEVMPDHVSLSIRSKPTYAIHFVVNQMKGYSFVNLTKEFTKLRSRLPTLWTRSYYVETIGNTSEDAMLKYIEKQKNV